MCLRAEDDGSRYDCSNLYGDVVLLATVLLRVYLASALYTETCFDSISYVLIIKACNVIRCFE